jgi:GATA zinc finger/HMG (high mobility group) box
MTLYGLNKTIVSIFKKMKICSNCGSTSTPAWRKGNVTDTWLCNACGLRSKRRLQNQMLWRDNQAFKNLALTSDFCPLINELYQNHVNKRFPASFVYFSKLWRQIVLDRLPGISFGQTSSEVSRIWHSLSEKDKHPYRYLAETAKVYRRFIEGESFICNFAPIMQSCISSNMNLIAKDFMWTCGLHFTPSLLNIKPQSSISKRPLVHDFNAGLNNRAIVIDLRKKAKNSNEYYISFIPT